MTMPRVNNNRSQQCIDRVQEFAKNFVQSVIDEAIRQSLKTTWLIHCSEDCHRLNPLDLKNSDSYICWTPESMKSSPSTYMSTAEEDEFVDQSLSCNLMDIKRRENTTHEDMYTLPVDSVDGIEFNSTSFESTDKCLKPKAIHALNLFRSGHQKTFNDFKLFLFNLYSSNDVSPKKIGSDHSVFTKYFNDATNSEDKRIKKDENFTMIHYKTDKDLKMMRKSNRMKRSNFLSIRHSFCNMFKLHRKSKEESNDTTIASFRNRSLPPLPSQIYTKMEHTESLSPVVTDNCACSCENGNESQSDHTKDTKKDSEHFEYESSDYFDDVEYVNNSDCPDFAANISKVKDYGWYWGPMSGEAAEKLLENEQDGSFIVRDSSDERYIFSLTFKLNACIRHVRIEHGQGNFSFGNHTRFRSHTIVDFIENAVRHSRSGRYLFFLHRRPILGPMRVQLLYPVSRFKHVQSLQHMCRFVIRKNVRRDLITLLPLPKSLIEYLSSHDYYIEQIS